MIRIRIDVDYPYPSRIRSFFYTALGIRISKDYLKNAKIIAKMINESSKDVKAYWFFTSKTIPDRELLQKIGNGRHEVALHVVNNPDIELRFLEKTTGRKANYFTIHGTARFFTRIMWKRWKGKAPRIPQNFPLKSFHEFATIGIDGLCYSYPPDIALRKTVERLKEGYIMYFHPVWLFQRGTFNHRGPFYNVFKKILEVDSDIETITDRTKIFFKIGRDSTEYEKDIKPTDTLQQKLRERGFDVFTFPERRWCSIIPNPSGKWTKNVDNIALLKLTSYSEWWERIGKKTRNMIRKAGKNGVIVRIIEPDEKFAEGIWKIFNETPIRQGRAFPHYGTSLQKIRKDICLATGCTYLGAYLRDELVGYAQLVRGKKIVIISQILSLQKHWDKAVNNAIIAKTVEICASEHEEWIMYGRIGNHPSLDNFKQSNQFEKFTLPRYYIPLTQKGKVAVKLGLHREIKDALPQSFKYSLIPVYAWISRTRMRAKLYIRH